MDYRTLAVLCVFVVVGVSITGSVPTILGSGIGSKPTANDIRLPGNWSKVCTNKLSFISAEFLTSLSNEDRYNISEVSCTLYPLNDSLLFAELREWMQNLERKVAVQVLCPTDSYIPGEISLPWPMKAKNLVWLHVDGCRVNDYYAEYFSTEITKIPDELRYLDLRNLQILFDPFLVPSYIRNTSLSSPDAECGPVTVEQLTMSNISFQIDISQDSSWESFANVSDNWDFENLFETLLSNFEGLNYTCNFTNLRSIDESYSQSLSKQHGVLLTSKSFYPEVRVYHISHSGLKSVPKELLNWSEHFPELKTFDLSYNSITEFGIPDLSPMWKSDGIYINLQFNNITTLTTRFIERVVNMSKVYIDLRNNPFLTDCLYYANFAEELEISTLVAELAKSNLRYILQSPCSPLEAKANAMQSSGSRRDWLYTLIPLAISCGVGRSLLTLFF